MRMCSRSLAQSSPQTLATVWRMQRTHPRVVTSSMRISCDRSARLAGMPTAVMFATSDSVHVASACEGSLRCFAPTYRGYIVRA